MIHFNIHNLRYKKILFGVKEAGAGSLIAELIRNIKPNRSSLVLSSSIASIYYDEIDIEVNIIDKDIPNKKIGKIIELLSPDYVIVGASANKSIEKQIITESIAKNIPVISFIDHYWNLWQRYADEKTAEHWAYKPNYIYVIDDICKEKLCELGWPKDQIGINPFTLKNKIEHKITIKDKETHNILDINLNNLYILFVSEYNFPQSSLWNWEQSTNEDIDFLLEFILKYIEDYNSKNIIKIKLIIKLHPSEDNRLIHVYDKFTSNNYLIVKNELSKIELFYSSNFVIGLNSMLLLEASNYGLPVYSYPGSLQKNAIRLNEIDQRINIVTNFKYLESELDKFLFK